MTRNHWRRLLGADAVQLIGQRPKNVAYWPLWIVAIVAAAMPTTRLIGWYADQSNAGWERTAAPAGGGIRVGAVRVAVPRQTTARRPQRRQYRRQSSGGGGSGDSDPEPAHAAASAMLAGVAI